LEDSATTDSVAEAKATKLVEHDHVDVIFGGIYSSTRQPIKGAAVVNGKKLYIYRNSTRDRSATRSSSVPARCRRSRLNL
jgi:ABC-type branched-subunit amino acid transport system substrate-binding protein